MSMGPFKTILGAGCLLMALAGQEAMAYWENMDLPGSDFRDFALTERGETLSADHEALYRRVRRKFAEECQQSCNRDQRCKAWTAHIEETRTESPPGSIGRRIASSGRCYLKDAAPAPVPRNESYLSGVRPAPPTVQRQHEPPASTEPPPPPPTGERLPERGMSVAENTNRPGHDYRAEDLDYPQAINCGRLCMDDPRCRAWTAVKPGIQGPKMRCWLKDAVPRPVRDDCCTSGVMPAPSTSAAPPFMPGKTPPRMP